WKAKRPIRVNLGMGRGRPRPRSRRPPRRINYKKLITGTRPSPPRTRMPPPPPIRPFPELAQAREGTQDLETAFARLTDSVKGSASDETPAALSANLQSFLPLSQRIAALAVSLDKEISS